MTGETVVYLGIGSNMNDPETQIEAAVATIDRLPTTRLLRRSPLYGSKPWGPVEQADYLNMVAEISTQLDPQTLLSRVKLIEKAQGLRVDPTCFRKSAAPLGGGHIASFIPMRIRNPVEECS